jgi:nitrogen fixation-related uncharacterized protein
MHPEDLGLIGLLIAMAAVALLLFFWAGASVTVIE